MSSFLSKMDAVMPAPAGAGAKHAVAGTSNRKYEGADRGRRTGSFPQNSLSANKDVANDGTLLRQRAKYNYQNTTYAKRAINARANGVVGTGIIPTVKCGNKRDEAKIKAFWSLWADGKVNGTSVKSYCDFYERLTFSGLEKLVQKIKDRDGEALILRRRVPVSESPIGMQLQVLEMEYVADYINYQVLPGGGWTMSGIEYDKRGKTVAYWLFQRHPSEWWTQPVRVPVADIIHVLDVDFAAQNRGVSAGASTIITERDLNEYEDAELMGKKVQAAHAVFRVTNDPEKLENANREDYDQDEDLERVEPGMMYHLFPGEDIKFNTPPTSQGAEDYRKSKQRNIAGGYEVTYEMMTGDYSNVNFSSGRMGWIEHSRSVEHWQWITLIPQFCNKVFGWFLEQLLICPGGLTAIPADLTLTWTSPKREMLDPVKESEATKNLMRMGKLSWAESVKEDGYVPEEVIESYKQSYKMWQDAGLKAEWSVDLDPTVQTPAQLKGEK